MKNDKPAVISLPPKRLKTPYKLGLALGGGGAKGIAHIGVLRAFEQEGIVFDYIAGTSAGSIVGAALAAGFNSYEMETFSRTLKESDIRNSKFVLKASNSRNIEVMMDNLLEGKTFNQLQTPFAAVAVNLATGQQVAFREGRVSIAVAASCAVPFIFSPVTIDGQIYYDGGLLNNVPADVARQMGADFIISVSLQNLDSAGTTSPRTLEKAAAIWRIVMKSAGYAGDHYSDYVIRPDMSKFKSTSLMGASEMIEEGYNAAKALMPDIIRELKNR